MSNAFDVQKLYPVMQKFSRPRTLSINGAAVPLSPNGEPVLQLAAIEGEEELSKIYTYDLEVKTSLDAGLSDEEAANLNTLNMIGKELTVTIQLDGMGTFVPGVPGATGAANIGRGLREISGIVTAVSFAGQSNRQSRYRLKLQPWIALAEKRSDYRIFQNKSVIEIIREVLGGRYLYSWDMRLSASYPELVYQVQYGESDFHFIQRLMEENGIYWFFEHSDTVHRMILVDQLGVHKPVDSEAYQTLSYYPPGRRVDMEHIDNFDTTARIQSGQWTTNDFDFTRPRANLEAQIQLPQDTSHNTLERYEWPGDYTEREAGEQFARIRMQEMRALGERGTGGGNVRNVVCGTTFTLAGFPQTGANREYLVIRARLDAAELDEATDTGEYRIRTRFEVQPATTVFRPPRTVSKPRTTGPQTAIVTGADGSEIYTDQYGRVKVKFHWDRSPVRDQTSSCWLRVSYPWAGNNYGTISIPRVGSEVIVDFENGDPDRPFVTGRHYNAHNMPPWELPANATQSGTLTRSTDKGGYETANALRFEDRKGREEIWFHAERDMRTEVENDELHTVAHDRAKTIGHDESVTIDNDRTEKVGRGEQVEIGVDRRHTIGQDAFLSVGRDHRIQIGKDRIEETGNNRKDTIAANFQVTTGGNAEHKVQGRHQVEAGQAIERKTRIYQLQAGDKAEIIGPAGKITLDGEGVTIEGVRIKLKGPVQTETGWVKNALDMRSDVNKGDPFTPDYFPFSG